MSNHPQATPSHLTYSLEATIVTSEYGAQAVKITFDALNGEELKFSEVTEVTANIYDRFSTDNSVYTKDILEDLTESEGEKVEALCEGYLNELNGEK